MAYKTKQFSDYCLPARYIDVIQGYFADAKTLLGDNMLMFMLTSSCSLNACIDGFSDVDILIVVKELDFANLKAMHEAQTKYDIKIALAMLSRYELNTGLLDDKTNVVFFQITSGMAAPNYVADDSALIFPHIELRRLQQNDALMLPYYLHKLRRLLYRPMDDKRTIIKLFYIVVKMRLWSEGHEVIVTSYHEAFSKFAIEFKEEDFDIVSEITSLRPASNEFITFSRRIIEKICNGQI